MAPFAGRTARWLFSAYQGALSILTDVVCSHSIAVAIVVVPQ